MPLIENIHEQEYISKPAPKSHFFTETNSYTQSASQAFGPEAGNLANRFRVTSKFTSAGAKAFACCKGVVLVQPQSGDNNKVNVILRPYTQPIQGVQIKYFIYRGLNKADFFNNNNIIASSSITSDFINKINADFVTFHTTPGNDPIPLFQSKFIGYNPSEQLGTMLLDDIFFKQSQYTIINNQEVEVPITAYELPMIDIGKSLGNFAAGECGIDIVLNYGDYKLPSSENGFVFDLNYAQNSECYIDFVGTTTDYEKKVRREQICQFLDVAAFYGTHFSEEGLVVIDNNGIKENIKLTNIYSQVINNFYSKNRLYLYIQSDRGRTYNFYENYLLQSGNPESLKIGLTENSLSAISFDENGWPLLIDEMPRTHNEANNNLFIQFVTDNNLNTALYGRFARLDNAQKNNFCGAENLSLVNESTGLFERTTRVINISNPAVEVSGQKQNIASFNILFYQGMQYRYKAAEVIDGSTTIDIYSDSNFLDDIFLDINAQSIIKNTNNANGSSLIFFKTKLITYFKDNRQLGIAAIQVAKLSDILSTSDISNPELVRVTYLTNTIDVLNNISTSLESIAGESQTGSSGEALQRLSNGIELPSESFLEIQNFTDSTELIKGLKVKNVNDSLSSKILLGLTFEENQELVDLVSIEGVNSGIFLLDLFSDGNELISIENIHYQKFKLGVVSEIDGVLELRMPPTNIFVYSLDNKYYFSEEYSRYVTIPELFLNDITLNKVEP